MAKLKAVFFPSHLGDIDPFYANAYDLLNKGLAAKYSIDAGKMAKILAHNGAQPGLRTAAEAAALASKSAHQDQDDEYAQGKLDLLDVFGDINKSSILDETDAEALGMRKMHTPADPDKAKPRITHVTVLPSMVVLDWIKAGWHGVVVYASYDGVNFTRIDKDTRSPYEDMRLNKTANTPELRYYKLRYMDKTGKEIGLDSEITKVTVLIDEMGKGVIN